MAYVSCLLLGSGYGNPIFGAKWRTAGGRNTCILLWPCPVVQSEASNEVGCLPSSRNAFFVRGLWDWHINGIYSGGEGGAEGLEAQSLCHFTRGSWLGYTTLALGNLLPVFLHVRHGVSQLYFPCQRNTSQVLCFWCILGNTAFHDNLSLLHHLWLAFLQLQCWHLDTNRTGFLSQGRRTEVRLCYNFSELKISYYEYCMYNSVYLLIRK